MALESYIGRIAGGQDLALAEMTAAIETIMAGQAGEQEIALLLTGLSLKGETGEELAGVATALRQHMTPIRSRHEVLLDTCGTGGDGSESFNISTAAAIVIAAAGVPVAKHGNRRISSRSGSADVLRELGVNIEAQVPQVEACLDELGICFCFAPLLHPAMKAVSEVRRKLGVPTIFNLVGPLVNPASAPYQLLGVGHPERRGLLAEALARLGTRHAAVVCGSDGLDEVTLSGVTQVTEIGSAPPHETYWHPADFGLTTASLEGLKVDGPAASAEIIRQVLAGQPGPARDIVLLNAGAALWVAEKADTLRQGAETAAAALDSGTARELLTRLAEVSHR